MFKITEKQIKELAEHEKFVENPRLLQRISVIQMLGSGLKNKDIEKIKKLSHWTVSAYKKAYLGWWIEKMLKWWYSWRVWKLTEKQKNIIKEKGGKEWFDTASEAQNFIKENFWIEYKLRRVQYLLKKWNFHTRKQKKYQEMLQTKKSKKTLR